MRFRAYRGNIHSRFRAYRGNVSKGLEERDDEEKREEERRATTENRIRNNPYNVRLCISNNDPYGDGLY